MNIKRERDKRVKMERNKCRAVRKEWHKYKCGENRAEKERKI
jgi:hypothetical protein